MRLLQPLDRLAWLKELTMLPVLILLVVGLGIVEPSILLPTNVVNVFSQSAVVAIAAIGATIVILTGGIDLSVGSTISASGVATAAVMSATGNVALGMLAGVALGATVGFITGSLITRLALVPFIVTLAGLFVVAGATVLLSSGTTISNLPTGFTGLSVTAIAGIPVLVLVAIALYVVAQLVLSMTVWGRQIMLLGASRRTSLVTGIPVARTEGSVYVVAGVFSGFAGVAMTANLFGANASMASGLLLNVVGAVVLGGTSLFGGRGSVARTGIGVLLLGFLANGMNLIGLASYDQVAVTGFVILAAATLDAWLHRSPG
jgi:ribose transport system permease protein